MMAKGKHGNIIGWLKPGRGKFYKRQLHKAERRALKAKMQGRRASGVAYWRSEVNMKGF